MPLLEAIGLAVRGARAVPLAGPVDLALDPGEVLLVEGPSGSGKTTLLRALALLDDRALGTVRLAGAPVDDVPAYRRRVVYVPQQPPAFPGTVDEGLRRVFAFRSAGAPPPPDAVRSLFGELHLPPDVGTRRHVDLSVGEAQRVGLARALLVSPTVLLLDEPTSALDPASRDAAERLLGRWLEVGGRAAVLVSHDPAQGRRLGTSRRRLWDGRLEPAEALS